MRLTPWKIMIILVILVVGLTLGYTTTQPKTIRIRATTTTSLYVTGLLDYLADQYRLRHPGVIIDFIAVGSGEALRIAESGDICMVLVHAPNLEKQYIDKGVIEDGHIFAYDYFIIAGPLDDPADVRDSKSVVEAFKKIYMAGMEGKTVFVSRGDYSGTHIRELIIWRKVGLNPHGEEWYLETGSGMAQTLLVANEKRGYVLSDIGTYLKLREEGRIPNLEILYSNLTELINIYSIYLVNSCSGIEREYALDFIEFVLGEGQSLIAGYGVDEYGRPLFRPADDRGDQLREIWLDLAEENP